MFNILHRLSLLPNMNYLNDIAAGLLLNFIL